MFYCLCGCAFKYNSNHCIRSATFEIVISQLEHGKLSKFLKFEFISSVYETRQNNSIMNTEMDVK